MFNQKLPPQTSLLPFIKNPDKQNPPIKSSSLFPLPLLYTHNTLKPPDPGKCINDLLYISQFLNAGIFRKFQDFLLKFFNWVVQIFPIIIEGFAFRGSGLRISRFRDFVADGLVQGMKVGFSGILNLWLLYWGPVGYQYLSDMCYSF